MVSTSPVPPAELSPKMEATLAAEMGCEPMTVTAWQKKTPGKLNLDGLSNWTPRNAAAAREFILAFHDIFALDGNELGCMSAIEHKIHINNSEPFKEWFRHIPPLLLEEVHTSLRECWMWELCTPASPHGATHWYWFRKRMELCASV